MANTEVTGAIKPEDIPVEARTLMQKGIWMDAAEQIAKDRKRGMVTVMTVKAANRRDLEAEFRRMRNGLQLPIRKYGLKLSMGIVRISDTEAKCYMETSELPQARRNGRTR